MDSRKLKDKAQEAFAKGKFAKAAESYAQYCEVEASDLHARLRMGDAYSKAGQKEKAIGAYSWAAEGFAKEGFLPRAIAASKLILELDPAHKGVQKMLADLYARKNQPVGAKKPGAAGPAGVGPAGASPAASRGISLEPAKPAGATPARAAAKAEPPSPMNRADAIELPPDDGPPPDTAESERDRSQRQSFEHRKDAIELPPASAPPLAPPPGPLPRAIELAPPPEIVIGLDVATVGGSSGPGSGEIEIAVIDSAPSVPSPPAREQGRAPAPPGPVELDPPLAVGTLLDPPAAPRPPPRQAAPATYELDVGEDETLEGYAQALGAKVAPPPVAARTALEGVPAPSARDAAPADSPRATEPLPAGASGEVPPPAPSAPLDLVIEVEPGLSPPAGPRPADVAVHSHDELAAPAPAAELPPPSMAVPSIAPVAPPPAPPPPRDLGLAAAAEASSEAELAPRASPSAPPGLRPRRAADAPRADEPAAPAASDARIWLPPGFAPPAVAPLAEPGLGARAAQAPEAERGAATDLERSLEAFARFDVDAPAPKRPAPAPQAAPVPALAAAGFTELELEGDSLLHAVEAAAHQGVEARGEAVPTEEAIDALEPEKAEPGALPKIPLFSDLPEDAFIALFERCPLKRHEPGELVVEQGSKGEAFYVICAGSVRVFRTDQGRRRELATLDEGAFFGEMALLSDAPRSASVEAASPDTQLLEISASVLADLSKQHPQVAAALKKFCRQRMLSNLMGSAPLFQPFSRSDRRDLVQKFRSREAKKGELVIKEGQRSDGMYVILSGEVDVTVGEAKVASLKEGDVFGEMSLLTKAPATASVTSARRTSLLRLPREDFDTLILSHPQILVLVSELTDERKRRNAQITRAVPGAGGAAPMV